MPGLIWQEGGLQGSIHRESSAQPVLALLAILLPAFGPWHRWKRYRDIRARSGLSLMCFCTNSPP